jgi:hypothetical protein
VDRPLDVGWRAEYCIQSTVTVFMFDHA